MASYAENVSIWWRHPVSAAYPNDPSIALFLSIYIYIYIYIYATAMYSCQSNTSYLMYLCAKYASWLRLSELMITIRLIYYPNHYQFHLRLTYLWLQNISWYFRYFQVNCFHMISPVYTVTNNSSSQVFISVIQIAKFATPQYPF